MNARTVKLKTNTKKASKTAEGSSASTKGHENGSASTGNGMTKADISTMRAWKKTYENRDNFLN